MELALTSYQAVMLSIARSRLTIPSQAVFLAVNTLGLVVGILYNVQTPDLYENNAHHKIGWIATWAAVAWLLVGVLTLYTRARSAGNIQPQLQPVTQQAMAEYHRFDARRDFDRYRWSHDSGQGTERNTESLASNSRSNSCNESVDLSKGRKPEQEDDDEDGEEARGFLRDTRADRFLAQSTARFTGRTSKAVNTVYVILERCIIPLAFITFMTGLVTYSGIGYEHSIFNVLAHLIKGGIFFWYGLLTFGRWMGCFSDFGWAWNVKPEADIVGRARARIPSAEFTESFVIFLYGASNVFLEHLSGWGKAWEPMDFEHVSITIMFFGGGLVSDFLFRIDFGAPTYMSKQLGMLIESRRVRNLLLGTLDGASEGIHSQAPEWQTPRSYVHPLNPIPSLVILLLGIMMSNHTQHSMIAGQVHKQWGLLFAGFALARSLTYVTFWLKPPTTYLPSRPPTELLASFCLVSGGLIFMASNSNTIGAMEAYSLDSMFVFTVMMGLTAIIMAWCLIVVVVKAWAVRREQKRLGHQMSPSAA